MFPMRSSINLRDSGGFVECRRDPFREDHERRTAFARYKNGATAALHGRSGIHRRDRVTRGSAKRSSFVFIRRQDRRKIRVKKNSSKPPSRRNVLVLVVQAFTSRVDGN